MVEDYNEVRDAGGLCYEDLKYFVGYEVFDHRIEFKVFQIIRVDIVPIFHDSDHRITKSIEDAEIYLEGSVKWDGCSNWNFAPALHACSRKELVEIGTLLGRLHDLGKKIPHWSGDDE